jgi:protein-tyrosine phosphatase
MTYLKFEESRRKVRENQKLRVLYIPKSAFVKRKGMIDNFLGLGSAEEFRRQMNKINDQNNNNNMSATKRRRIEAMRWRANKKKDKENSNKLKQYYKIVYQDSVIPDEVFKTEDFQTLRKQLFIQNIHDFVTDYYTNKA